MAKETKIQLTGTDYGFKKAQKVRLLFEDGLTMELITDVGEDHQSILEAIKNIEPAPINVEMIGSIYILTTSM